MLGEARQAMLLSRLGLGLASAEQPALQNAPGAWMGARQALELATLGGARVLGRDDIGALEVGRRADFFTVGLDHIAYAGARADPVAALLFCAPQQARHTVVEGRPIVRDGRIVTLDMAPVVAEHDRHARRLLDGV
jgi:cytosine/adenosine deaminase-related metal-dependent hydrolase